MTFTIRLQYFVLAALLVGGRAVAVPFGADGGAALQAVFNNVTINPAGASSVNVLTDEVAADS